MPKKLSFKERKDKKIAALRRQGLKVNPVTFGVKTTLEMQNKAVLDKLAAALGK